MGYQMSDDQKERVRDAIMDADPAPEDMDDCVQLLTGGKVPVFSPRKVRAFGAEFRKVCEQALDARGARNAMTPPTSDIAPRGTADAVPDPTQYDGALRAAAASCSGEKSEMVHLYRSSTRTFHFASAKITNAELSYIKEHRLSQLNLQHNDHFIQVGWMNSSIPIDGDHSAKETVFVPVSNEQALADGMNADILLGRLYREGVEVQLQAVRRLMDLQSPPSPCDIQPDESCAGSVAEAAILPPHAAKSPAPPLNISAVFMGPDSAQQLASFCKAMTSSGLPFGPG